VIFIGVLGEGSYKKWKVWGTPETLDGTNDKYWVAYISKINVSFISEKKTDKVIYSAFDKYSAIDFLNKKIKAREELLGLQFSPWDGSHRGLEQIIKKNMNDPNSYEHIETVYWDQDDYLIVRTTFRGKNAFGALVVNWIKAKSDIHGNVIDIIESYPR